MSWTITKEDVRKISVGAQVLSCGGGGKTNTAENILLSVMNDDDVIIVKTINELMDEWVLPVAVVGSPVLFSEDLPIGTEFQSLVKQYEKNTGKEVNAIISLEIGGMNAISPLIAALQTDLPVVDGDGTGRASPELDMTAFSLNGVPLTPLILKAQDTFSMITNTENDDVVRDQIKELVSKDSGYVHFAGSGMSGNQAKASMVPGTLQLAYKLGKMLLEEAVSDKMEHINNEFENSVYGGSEVVFHGVISSVERWFENKSLVGVCEISGMFAYTNRQIVIRFQNEFLSIEEHEMICSTPDLISVMNSETLFPYNTSDIQEGDEVFVMAIPAPSILRTTEMIQRMGPLRFGLNGNYQPFHLENGGAK